MKKIFLALALISPFAFHLSPTQLSAQNNNPVIIEIGGRQIRQQEFMKDFNQSVGDGLTARNASEAEKTKALADYVELYANFQAKLLDARAEGMDTAEDLREELGRYRKDLAAPYLIDSAMLQKIMHEAYERNRYALHAVHILVKVRPDASEEDTLKAYNRALELRARAVAGENFHDLAIEEVRRQRPEADVHINEGELNYFTSFDMVYPFENGAYALEPGEISQPVRSRYGYHIIKLIEKVEYYGKATLQHYWKRNPDDKDIVAEAYQRLLSGTPFEMVARQSDDLSTAASGGYLVDATMQQLPHEFVTTMSHMQNGEISKPFLTRYGWHILHLLKKDTLPPFEKMEAYYKQRMSRDMRGEASRKSFAASARKKYGIVDYTTTPVVLKGKKKKSKEPVKMMATLDEFTSHLNDDVFAGKWKIKDSVFTNMTPLVKVPGKDYNVLDFVAFVRKTQKKERRVEPSYYARQHFDEFLDSVSIAYADSQLENENPDFAALVEEYRRGLMIFNYNEKNIWVKALKDSVGFANFFARESVKKSLQNPEDSIYFWRTRARVLAFDVADSRCLDPQKAEKILRKAVAKDLSSTDMQDALLKKVDKKHCEQQSPVNFNIEVVEQGHQHLLADEQWTPGIYRVDGDKGYRLLVVQEIVPPCLKGQMEARGYYLNAWQNEVEENLCRDLRKKYNVKIHYDVVGTIRY
ncbi:MAG: peptidylprolyl isomerase [Bacteroidales bacterium]|nr:peptidylprolyl isomerase [Bacteroidales bacterium]